MLSRSGRHPIWKTGRRTPLNCGLSGSVWLAISRPSCAPGVNLRRMIPSSKPRATSPVPGSTTNSRRAQSVRCTACGLARRGSRGRRSGAGTARRTARRAPLAGRLCTAGGRARMGASPSRPARPVRTIRRARWRRPRHDDPGAPAAGHAVWTGCQSQRERIRAVDAGGSCGARARSGGGGGRAQRSAAQPLRGLA